MSSFKEHRYLNMPNWLLFVDGTISIISSFFGWMCDSSRWILFLLFWEKESCESTYSIGREVCQSMKIERVSSVQQERYDLRCAATVFYCTVCNDAYLFECQKKTFPHNLSDFTALLKACIIYCYKVKGSFQLFFAVFFVILLAFLFIYSYIYCYGLRFFTFYHFTVYKIQINSRILRVLL